MVDIDARRRLSDALRALVAGLVTNDEFEARLPDLRSADRAIGALFHHGAWFLYSDLSEHRLTGRHALSPQARRDVARWVLFLRSGLEYEWPHPTRSQAALAVLLSLLTLGAWRRVLQARWRRAGDPSVWPFIRASDFDVANAGTGSMMDAP